MGFAIRDAQAEQKRKGGKKAKQSIVSKVLMTS